MPEANIRPTTDDATAATDADESPRRGADRAEARHDAPFPPVAAGEETGRTGRETGEEVRGQETAPEGEPAQGEAHEGETSEGETSEGETSEGERPRTGLTPRQARRVRAVVSGVVMAAVAVALVVRVGNAPSVLTVGFYGIALILSGTAIVLSRRGRTRVATGVLVLGFGAVVLAEWLLAQVQ